MTEEEIYEKIHEIELQIAQLEQMRDSTLTGDVARRIFDSQIKTCRQEINALIVENNL